MIHDEALNRTVLRLVPALVQHCPDFDRIGLEGAAKEIILLDRKITFDYTLWDRSGPILTEMWRLIGDIWRLDATTHGPRRTTTKSGPPKVTHAEFEGERTVFERDAILFILGAP